MAAANHGASISDLVAIGDEQESLQEWRKRCDIEKSSQIRLVKLAHMRYQHPDLTQITTFLHGIVPYYLVNDTHSLLLYRLWYDCYQENRSGNLVPWIW